MHTISKTLLSTVLLGILMVSLLGCTQTTPEPTKQPTTSPLTPPSESITNPPSPVTKAPVTNKLVDVNIESFAFTPPTLIINAGDTVVWRSFDSATHILISSEFTTGSLHQGSVYQYTFTKPGAYPYSCTIHTEMHGTIIVE